LTDFLNRLERRLPGRVERCTLFGSWARGEGRPGSDLGLLPVADHQAAEFIAVVESLIAPPS